MKTPHITIAALALLFCYSLAGAQTAPPLPTQADLHKMFDEGQYRTTVQQIARVLALKGDLAKPYDRGDLVLLRADSMLHMKDADTALRAYTQAIETEDHKQSQVARGMALLIQKSPGLLYTPRTAGAPPIDIVDSQSRAKALAAMFADEYQDARPMIDKATEAQNLVPIIDVLPRLRDLTGVEMAATGDDKTMHPIRMAIAEQGRGLITEALKTEDQKISQLEQTANQQVDIGPPPIAGEWWWNSAVTRRGLFSEERKTLRDEIDYLTKIQNCAEHGQEIARSYGGTGEKWEPVVNEAQRVLQHAQAVLAAE